MSVENAIQDKAYYERFMLATAHQKAGRLQEARDIYRALLDETPDNTDALHLLGMLCHQAGNAEMGISLIEKAIELNPDFPLFLNNFGHIQLSIDQLDSAETTLLRATQLDTDMLAPLYGLAECYRRKGKFQKAADFVEYVLERDPQHVDALVCLGQIHMQNNSAKKALELFEMVLSIKPDHIYARFHAARTHYVLAQYDKSIAILQSLLQQHPDYVACYNNLGNAYMAKHQYEDAKTAYQNAIRLKPRDANMQYNLAVAISALKYS